jgi:hypothetical protein
VHCEIGKNNKHSTVYAKANAIHPQRLHVEAKAAQDSRARDLNVETILVVDETEVLDFVDDESFKGVVKYR